MPMPNTAKKMTQEERLRVDLARREAELKLLLEASQALSMDYDVNRLLQIVAD
ncbi:MAG: hypothetical protein GWO08_06155, partial [Gammaproteobacteria bacterium]|nr:hypothetical protein [Gammaproteobacteria bacterium]